MKEWFLYFIFYSFAGYLLEKLYARLVRSPSQVRKCFLLLPLCPVYGVSMLAVLALVPDGTGPLGRALLGGIICTGAEYFAHLFYEKALLVRFWDYSALRWHLRGRVCPQFAVIWGVLSALAVYFVQPLAARLAAGMPPGIAYALWLVLAADCVFTVAVLRERRDPEQLAWSHIWSFSQVSTS